MWLGYNLLLIPRQRPSMGHPCTGILIIPVWVRYKGPVSTAGRAFGRGISPDPPTAAPIVSEPPDGACLQGKTRR